MKNEPPTVTAATIEVTYSDGTRERHTFNGAKKVTFQIGLAEPYREYHVGDGEPYFTNTVGQIEHLQFSLQYLTPYPNGVVWMTEDLNSTEPLF
jgi:hypothetical protein